MAWLNIDNPTRIAMIHSDECERVVPGVKNEVNGNWKRYPTINDAVMAAYEFAGYNVRKCSFCTEQ